MSHISPPDYDRLNLGLRRPPTCPRTAPRACPTRSECRSPGWEGLFGCQSQCRRGSQKPGLRRDGHPYRPWQWQAKAEENVNDEKGKKTRNYFVQLVLNGVIGVFENSHPRRVRKKISRSIFQGGSHGGTIIGKAQNLKCILVTCALSNLIKNELVSWLGDFRFYRTLAKSFSTNYLSCYVHSTKSPVSWEACKTRVRVIGNKSLSEIHH